ncbi:hypothetical protein R3W88_014917 [Solanum pinnatisectum]|uniref:ubiquitinyl hydrolase 1 n=1 Tax=Solanum pinnatisectum TaxID=50273 RepID=A0AAV9KTC3_9SOLN|nr:hypothetical protein R3W88_014917 [Solanum pinnatisectum]
MVKGGLLKDDDDWSKVGVKEGQRLMMMGAADEIMKAPEKGHIFVEDMPKEEQVVNVGHSAGLFNLGSTCCMNSTVQCLHSVLEVKSSLTEYNQLFWMVLRKKYPQFRWQCNGAFMQQDAEECWTHLLYTLSQSLKSPSSSEGQDIVKTLFGIEFDNRIHCAESGEESIEIEIVYSLKCHILQEVNHLHEGLKCGLKLHLEKASPSLGRGAVYVKDSRINGLPRYLTIQSSPGFEDAEGKKVGLKTSAKTPVSTDSDTKMTEAEESSSGSGEASKSTSQEGVLLKKEHQLTGIYDFVAVLTHKGRSANSGHYVVWVKQENGKWVQFDDDNPIPQREEDITKLSGGGDWHMAYICMYKARVVSM